MAYPEPYQVEYNEGVKVGTAELFHGHGMVLCFHDTEDFRRWVNGASFRLINHWIKESPTPKYDVSERIKKR